MSSDFSLDLDIRWGDMDALGHVNHTAYLVYCEQARIAWWESLGIQFAETGPILVEAKVNYLKALTYPAHLNITLQAHSATRSSYVIDYQILSKGEVAAKAYTTMVWVNYGAGKSVPLPDDMLGAIA